MMNNLLRIARFEANGVSAEFAYVARLEETTNALTLHLFVTTCKQNRHGRAPKYKRNTLT